ncbi:hypothetical protein B0H63DRAFT_460937 [Podospora didyma]|uniref:GRF-type domain-containing protein n=1 Tax=Podospora didyma TaxID=330526 RepID=A0AAE0P6V5_9PEZI|nr:hypothetical protein B0H63DRAFT_460937 [Podospora didyma]
MAGFSTPGNRSQYRPRSTQKLGPKPDTGVFENGGWYCECEPRLPAVRLQVKKTGQNKGRWFYTCSKERQKQCVFFLWDEAAQERENNAPGPNENALVGTIGQGVPPLPSLTPRPIPQSRVVAARPPQTPGYGSSGGTGHANVAIKQEDDVMNNDDLWGDGSGSPGTQGRTVANSASKRKRNDLDSDDDLEDSNRRGDFQFPAFDSDEERQLMRLTARRQNDTRSQTQAQENTPSRRRAQGAPGLPTPVTRNSLLVTSELFAKRVKLSDGTPANATPTPVRTRDVLSGSQGLGSSQGPDSSQGTLGPGGEDYEITSDILRMLQGQQVSESVRHMLRDHLNSHALQDHGVKRGRDIVRTALEARDAKVKELQLKINDLETARDAKVAELHARIGGLENERKGHREKIKELHKELAAMYQDGHD